MTPIVLSCLLVQTAVISLKSDIFPYFLYTPLPFVQLFTFLKGSEAHEDTKSN